MSAPFVSLGPDARVLVEGVPYGVTGGSWGVAYETVDRTDAAATSKRSKQNPQRKLTLTLTAQRQSDVSPHTPPLSFTRPPTFVLSPGIHVQVWPNGLGDADGPMDVPGFLPKRVGGDWNLAGSAPQTLVLEGESNGDFTLPGE